MNDFSLKNKVILITGANGIIGKVVSQVFYEYGATLILLDKNTEGLEDLLRKYPKKLSNKIKIYNADITSQDQINDIISLTISQFRKIDVLVNLAAIDAKFDSNIDETPKTAFEDFPIDLWDKSLSVNLTGTFIVTQRVLKEMLKQKKGNIINVASTYSLVSPNQNLYKFDNDKEQLYKPIDYVATKSVIPNFSRYLATLYAKRGIRVNTIVPHGVLSDASEEFLRNFANLSPIGRMCNKDELRGPFLLLASDASSYMIGSTLVVDGGWTAW